MNPKGVSESGAAGRVMQSKGVWLAIIESTLRLECARIDVQPMSLNASAIAIAGATWPPLPPPAIKTLGM
jgi:hypothetical protein